MTHCRMVVLVICILLLAHGSGNGMENRSASGDPTNSTTGTVAQLPSMQSRSATVVPTGTVGQTSETTQVSEPISPGAELTLKQAISIALQYHPRIREAAENTIAAIARVGEARSFLGPQVFGVPRIWAAAPTASVTQVITTLPAHSPGWRGTIVIFPATTSLRAGMPATVTWADSWSHSFCSTSAGTAVSFLNAGLKRPRLRRTSSLRGLI